MSLRAVRGAGRAARGRCAPLSRQPPRRARRSRRAARGRKRKWGRGDHGAAGAGKEPPPAPGERAVGEWGRGKEEGRAEPEQRGSRRHP